MKEVSLRPVRNPELLAALRSMGREPSSRAEADLLRCLNAATYLAAVVVENGNTSGVCDGQEVLYRAGEQLSLVSARSEGKHFLPLFADFRAIRLYTKRAVAGVILSADEAWALILNHFDGAVINPANGALPLARELVESLKDRLAAH